MKRLCPLVLLTFITCTNDSTTPIGPTSVFESLPNGPAQPQAEPIKPQPEQAAGSLDISGNYGTCNFTVSHGVESLAVYRVLDNGSQVKLAFYSNPAEGNLQCGLKIQADCLSNTATQPEAGDINAYTLADFFIGVIECRTPPRNPPPPPQCEEPEDSGSFDCPWNPETCRFECEPPPPQCEPIGEPENECQEWNFNSCSWVGECPPPECQEDEVLVGDTCVPFCAVNPGDQTCAPSCEFGDAVWNGQTWDCPPPPPCPPDDTAECDGQVWNTDSCTWIGECLPPGPVCETPLEGATASGSGNPDAICGFFGNYVSGSPADFYVWKCGTNLEVHITDDGAFSEQCEYAVGPNGRPQDISHVDSCVCSAVN